MKRKIIGGAAIVAVALVSAININVNTNGQSGSRSLITMENIEALAVNEGGSPCGGPKEYGDCKSSNSVNCKDLSGCQ